MSIHTKKPVSPRICGLRAENAKIEVSKKDAPCSQDTLADTFTSAEPVPAKAPQRDQTKFEHPHGAGEPLCTPTSMMGREDMAMDDGYTIAEERRLGSEFGVAFGTAPKRSVEIDTVKYQKYLDDPSLSEEQKEEIIMALWSIITAFVDLGFGVHPAQEACGKAAEKLDGQAKEDSNESKAIHQSVRDAFNEKSRGI